MSGARIEQPPLRSHESGRRSLLERPIDFRLDGRVAWVTGASRGLGRAIALAFADAGAELLLTARDDSSLRRLAADIASAGGTAHTVAGSVTDAHHVAGVVALARHEWGRIDVLVNNAGISPAFVRAEQLSADEWSQILETNLSAPLRCAVAALPLLEAARDASVVNVSSIHGHAASERIAAYATSKGGLEMLTRSLALEWAARGIRVNAIAPGYMETEMTSDLREHERIRTDLLGRIPMARFGSVDEVAAVVLFLAGSMSSYLTGTTVFADGGWTAR